MRAVDLAPLVIESHDLGHLVIEQAVRRVAARRPVDQLAGRSTLLPPPGPQLTELEFPARTPMSPAGVDRVVQEAQQGHLGDLIDTVRDSATQPQRPLSLDQHQLDGHLLEGLAQPGVVGSGGFELPVPLACLHPGPGLG
jgi:hypothetical protein